MDYDKNLPIWTWTYFLEAVRIVMRTQHGGERLAAIASDDWIRLGLGGYVYDDDDKKSVARMIDMYGMTYHQTCRAPS